MNLMILLLLLMIFVSADAGAEYQRLISAALDQQKTEEQIQTLAKTVIPILESSDASLITPDVFKYAKLIN